ncbi:MAG: CDP-alcohol phosphatidyltransferase family protein, partial [Proteobacteria bacterium]|nr:CDP-alcohol phosphatidyltransferase family protein [Pseudomonadota bacterium]
MNINIPNILTLTRILLAPLFVIFLLKNLFSFALLVFSVAAISDVLDGFLAKHLGQSSLLGAYLDPVADKLLIASAFVSLAILKILPAWLAVIVLTRDILIVTGIGVLTMAGMQIGHPAEAEKLWWERGADKWYCKDDWKGLALTGGRSYR